MSDLGHQFSMSDGVYLKLNQKHIGYLKMSIGTIIG